LGNNKGIQDMHVAYLEKPAKQSDNGRRLSKTLDRGGLEERN
jgi:hypothetical protein